LSSRTSAFTKIDHFFVLMLENRSFDHMFGAAPYLQSKSLGGSESCVLDPNNPALGSLPITQHAGDVTHPDPPHEFKDICFQLTGQRNGNYGLATLTMNGFAASGREGLLEGESTRAKRRLASDRNQGAYVLDCHGASAVPVLRTLAREFAVCERWHASMPGPTWPNRFFVHAASSGGLDNSPGMVRSMGAVLIDWLGFGFEHGTIYDRLGDGNWRIYHGDALPQALAIKGLVNRIVGPRSRDFRRLEHLSEDLAAGTFGPRYVFIEPDHGVLSGGRNGNSQHPEGRVSAGENLIRDVYLAIRRSPLWEKSALIITYDEHGGFYDRIPPPKAIPPGDRALNHDKAEFPANFGFDLLGVRVPAVVISPWINKGTIDATVYDHTSILRTVEERFGLAPLTARDRDANSLGHLFARETLREDAPADLPEPGAIPPFDYEPEANEDDNADSDSDALSVGSLAGFLRIAISVDYLMAAEKASMMSRLMHSTVGRVFPAYALKVAPPIANRRDAREYIADVAGRLEKTPETEFER
jgi:phospholipase C